MFNAISRAFSSAVDAVTDTVDSVVHSMQSAVGIQPDPIEFDAANVSKALQSSKDFMDNTLHAGYGLQYSVAPEAGNTGGNGNKKR